MHAIRIHEFGGPEVLRLVNVAVGAPSPGQVRVRHDAVGLNMVDTYYRSGLYRLELPSGLGGEAKEQRAKQGDVHAADRCGNAGCGPRPVMRRRRRSAAHLSPDYSHFRRSDQF